MRRLQTLILVPLALLVAITYVTYSICSRKCMCLQFKDEATAQQCAMAPLPSNPSASLQPPPEGSEDPCTAIQRRINPDGVQGEWLCEPAPGGTWAANLVIGTPEPDAAELRIIYSPYMPDRPLELHQRKELLSAPSVLPQPVLRLSLGSVYDFDNDNISEFFVKVTRADKVGGDIIYGFFNKFSGTRIEDYAPAKDLPVDELRDVDLDGRTDLILAYPVTGAPVIKRCALGRNHYGHLRYLAHTLPDGHFTLNDQAAIDFAKKECPQRPSLELPEPAHPAELLQAVRCLRTWGVEPEQILVQIRRVCGKESARDSCTGACGPLQDYLFNYARFTPPLTLQ